MSFLNKVMRFLMDKPESYVRTIVGGGKDYGNIIIKGEVIIKNGALNSSMNLKYNCVKRVIISAVEVNGDKFQKDLLDINFPLDEFQKHAAGDTLLEIGNVFFKDGFLLHTLSNIGRKLGGKTVKEWILSENICLYGAVYKVKDVKEMDGKILIEGEMNI
jgi:hypothetical protein